MFKKTLGNFVFGFSTSFIIMTCTGVNIHTVADLLPYVGPSILGGLIFLLFIYLDERLEKIEKVLDKFLKD